jgi:hypothetical protein
LPEICGNCIDENNNGLTDFEDPACCEQSNTFSMSAARIRTPLKGSHRGLRFNAMLASTGLQSVNPLREDVFVQVRPEGGTDVLCARLPAAKFVGSRGTYRFRDPKHKVKGARGIDNFTLKVRSDGSVIVRTLDRRVKMSSGLGGTALVTVGFRNPLGNSQNSCSTTFEALSTSPPQ